MIGTVDTQESKITFTISDYSVRYIQKHYNTIDLEKIAISRLGIIIPEKIRNQKKKNVEQLTIGFTINFILT